MSYKNPDKLKKKKKPGEKVTVQPTSTNEKVTVKKPKKKQ